jgi:hypothetical protein
MSEGVRHSSKVEIATHRESSNFCSGSGTTKNVPEKFETGDLAQLSSMDKIENWNPPMPVRFCETKHGAMDTGDHGQVIPLYTVPGRGTISQWLQTKTNCDQILTGTIGTIPNSEDWHWDDGLKLYEVYGILIESFQLALDAPGGYVLQNRGVVGTQIKRTDGVVSEVDNIDLSGKAQSTAALVPARSVNVTIDTDKTQATLNVESFTFDVAMTYKASDGGDDHVLGSDYVLEPTLQSRTYELRIITHLRDANTWFSDLQQTTTQTFTIVLTLGTVAAFNMTNMRPMTAAEYNVGGRGRLRNEYGFTTTSSSVITQTL